MSHWVCDRCGADADGGVLLCSLDEHSVMQRRATLCGSCQRRCCAVPRVPWHLLPLQIEHDADGWVVADRWTLVYGDGTTLGRAVYDYLLSLRDWWQLRRRPREAGEVRGDGIRFDP